MKIGELLPPPSLPRRKLGEIKAKKTLPKGITYKQSYYFQKMADNKDIVEEVKAALYKGWCWFDVGIQYPLQLLSGKPAYPSTPDHIFFAGNYSNPFMLSSTSSQTISAT